MIRYILLRLLQSLATLIVMLVLIFTLVRVSGDPAVVLAPPDANVATMAHIREQLGLNDPLPLQFIHYVGDILRGDLGISFTARVPVSGLIGASLPHTALLACAGIVVAIAWALAGGMVAVMRPSSVLDRVVQLVSLTFLAAPAFITGLVLIWVFSVKFQILPVAGTGGISHFILPTIVLAGTIAPGILRLLRSALLSVELSDYIRTARAKGLPEWTVITRHMLRIASLSPLTYAGTYFAALLAGVVVTETVFNWPGLGRLVYKGVLARDFPVVQGVIIVTTIMVVLVNWLVDIVYGLLDPRIGTK